MNIEKHILEIIEQGKTEGNLFYLPNSQLDRKTYLDVNKVLGCLGGKWSRKLKAHVFEADISDAVDDILLTGEVIDKKKEFQFFETPLDVANQLIELAEVELGNECLEPSAGRGGIARPLREIAGKDSVTCVELMPENTAILAGENFQVYEGDFLQYVSDVKYDRVVMNPPFTRQQDISHVEKALLYLKDNGILTSVMSAGVMFRQNKKNIAFWDKIKEYDYRTVVMSKGAFKVSGTMVNTVILKVLGHGCS